MAGPRPDARRRTSARTLALLFSAAAWAFIPAAAPAQPVMPKPTMNSDWTDPASFASVQIDSMRDHACMPATQGYDEQLQIAAPARVWLRPPGVLVIPVCARGIVPAVQHPSLPRIVATDLETQKVYDGVAFEYKLPTQPGVEVDTIPSSRPPRGRPVAPGMSVGTQFSTDAAARAKLPAHPATYEVYVEANGLRSNTVKIEVQAAK
ncbi:hypothetical protein [Achromobacter pestifer]